MSHIRTIEQNDPEFYIKSGLMLYSRAELRINIKCPTVHAKLIQEALTKGWITLASNITDSELMWDNLSQ